MSGLPILFLIKVERFCLTCLLEGGWDLRLLTMYLSAESNWQADFIMLNRKKLSEKVQRESY